MSKKKAKTLSERVVALERVFARETWADRLTEILAQTFATKAEIEGSRQRPVLPVFRCSACGVRGVVGLDREGGFDIEFRAQWRFCPECGAEWKPGKLAQAKNEGHSEEVVWDPHAEPAMIPKGRSRRK